MTVDRNFFFRQATLAITGTLDLEKALDRCLAFINQYFECESLSFLLHDLSASTVRFLATNSNSSAFDLTNTVIQVPESLRPLVDQLRQDRRPFIRIVNRVEDLPEYEMIIKEFEKSRLPEELLTFRPHILMGLYFEGERFASLNAVKPQGRLVLEEEADLLMMLKDPLSIVVSNAMAHSEVLKLKAMLEDDRSFLQHELHSIVGDKIIGQELGLGGVMEMVEQVAPKNSPVMLFGETGVGKDLIANAIHYNSPRRSGPFIKVNCGAIPETLIDSELFGHEKGAFTGAVSQKRGRFERANAGTIFLDEIGELPPAAQVRLLRVLQSKEFERVGGSETVRVDVRVVSATNRNIEEMVRHKHFREDLFFRLNVFPILIPPVRQRKLDIPSLVHHFIEKKSIELKIPDPPSIAPGVMDRLMNYPWPGNVREMENLVERELIMNKGGLLRFDRISGSPSPAKIETAAGEEPAEFLSLQDITAEHIRRALKRTEGKIHGKGGAAELLGVNASTLRSRMIKLGLTRRGGRRSAR